MDITFHDTLEVGKFIGIRLFMVVFLACSTACAYALPGLSSFNNADTMREYMLHAIRDLVWRCVKEDALWDAFNMSGTGNPAKGTYLVS